MIFNTTSLRIFLLFYFTEAAPLTEQGPLICYHPFFPDLWFRGAEVTQAVR